MAIRTAVQLGKSIAQRRVCDERRLQGFASSVSSIRKIPETSETVYDHSKVLLWDSLRQRWQNILFRLGNDPRYPAAQRRKIVVVGTGWGSVSFLTNIDIAKFDVTVVSPRTHFTMTPLLPSASAGTLTPRSCVEPVRTILLRGGKKVMNIVEGWATSLNPDENVLVCHSKSGDIHKETFDYLVVGVGSEPNTFGIPGVTEHAEFLKDAYHARSINQKVITCFEQANFPSTTAEEKRRLLHFVVVGAGPTGVETAAELSDLMKADMSRHFPDLIPFVKITLVEMLPKVLAMFSEEASKYAVSNLRHLGVNVELCSRVTNVTEKSICIENTETQTISISPCGFVLWASGISQVPFAKTLLKSIPKQIDNRILRVDGQLKLIGLSPRIYAVGDCSLLTPQSLTDYLEPLYEKASRSPKGAGTTWLLQNASSLSRLFTQLFPPPTLKTSVDHLGKEEFGILMKNIDESYKPPSPTAQAAAQQGSYLASVFNNYIAQRKHDEAPVFVYRWNGSLSYVGAGKAIFETSTRCIMGVKASFIWKVVYWSKQLSTTNRFLTAFDWIKTVVSGRDIIRDHTHDHMPASMPKHS